MKKNEIVLFESKDGKVTLPVSVDVDTVWLSLLQMAELFDKDKSVIFRHVKNAISDGEIDPKVTIAKFAMVTPPCSVLSVSNKCEEGSQRTDGR